VRQYIFFRMLAFALLSLSFPDHSQEVSHFLYDRDGSIRPAVLAFFCEAFSALIPVFSAYFPSSSLFFQYTLCFVSERQCLAGIFPIPPFLEIVPFFRRALTDTNYSSPLFNAGLFHSDSASSSRRQAMFVLCHSLRTQVCRFLRFSVQKTHSQLARLSRLSFIIFSLS